MITLRCCPNGPRLIQMLPVTRMYCSKDTTQPMFDPMKKVCDILMYCPKSGLDIELDQSGIRPSKELVEEVIKRFENAGMLVHRFFEWAGRQRHYDHSVKAYHAMIESLAKIRQYQVMWDLVNVMKGKGLLNVETFCIIMRKYARAKKVEEAVYTFNVMKKYDVPPNLSALNGLLSALCKSKNVRKAQEIFDSMKDRFAPDVKTYSILLEGWGREPNLPKAREIYKEICTPDIVTYGIMVDILCKAGRVDEAVGIIKEMELGGCKPTSFIYSVLIHTYGIYNRIEDAIDAFHEMQKSGLHPDVAVYNSLIGAFCKVKRYKNAYKVLAEMDRVGVPPNSRTCNVILSGLISEGETDEAFRVFRKMIKICDPDADTYTMMIKMFCANKEILMARKIWKHMKANQFVPGMHTFSVLINGMCDEGDPRRACKLMEEMIEKGMRPDRETFGKLRHLLLKEDRKDVLEFLHEKMDLLVKEPLCD